MNPIFKELKDNKIKINWNKKPIKMDLFLSFLTVDIEVVKTGSGYDNGWTEKVNKYCNLIIYGGIVNNIDYLDAIKYGKKLSNPCNDYVNPFYLFEIMTDEGKKFFIDYYSEEIIQIKNESISRIERYKTCIKQEK